MAQAQTPLAQKIAKLARIRVSEEETEAIEEQFKTIVDYIHQLDEVIVPEGTEPFFGATESVNATRQDAVVESYPRERILENSPQTDGEFYRVPPVFEK